MVYPDEVLDVPSGALSRAVAMAGRLFGTPVVLDGGMDVAFERMTEDDAVELVPPSGVGDTLLNMLDAPLRNDELAFRASTREMYLAKILLAVSAYEMDADFKKTYTMIGWARHSPRYRADACANALMKLTELLERERQDTGRILDEVTARKTQRIIRWFAERGEFIEDGRVRRERAV
jgi:hypothetical protein